MLGEATSGRGYLWHHAISYSYNEKTGGYQG